MANYLSTEKKIRILELLIEGNSVRGTARLCNTNIKTVLRQLVECGEKARQFLHQNLRRINVGHVQCDEIWTFVGKKQARVAPEERSNPKIGDQYLFVALDTDSKLVCTYALGKRDQVTTDRFVEDLARRIVVNTASRPQISTDGWTCYPDAIESSFGHRVDYGQIIKVYANDQTGRYAPPEVVESVRKPMWGIQNLKSICTSHVERNNLTIRTFMKRFSRLTLGFSKKVDNLRAAVALHVFHYNFCRIHSSLRSTPAMKAKLTNRLWKLEDLFAQTV